MTAQQPIQLSPERVEEIRGEFEAMAQARDYSVRRDKTRNYTNASTLAMWIGYLAASTAREADRVDAERWRYWSTHPVLRLDRFLGQWRVTTATSVLTDWFDTPDAAIDAARALKEIT